MTDYFGNPFARQDTAATVGSLALTAAIYRPDQNTRPRAAVITVSGTATDSIQYTRDGTTPVLNTTGDFHLAGNVPIVLWGQEAIAKFRFIIGAGTPIVHATYFR